MSSIKLISLKNQDYKYILDTKNNNQLFAYLPNMFSFFLRPALAGVPQTLWGIEYNGLLVGSAGYCMAEGEPELWLVGIMIWPAYRRQGFGTQVYNHLLATLRPKGAHRLLTSVYSNQVAGQRFLQGHGWQPCSSSIHYQLDLATAELHQDENADLLLANQGLRWITLEQLPRRGLAARLLPIWNLTRPDQPQPWPYVPYYAERFEREILEPAELALAHSLAIVGQNNQIVALNLQSYAAADHLYTTYLGVDPDYRGRGLAKALKQKLLVHARRHSIALLSTDNDACHRTMRRINEQLGYQPIVELVTYTLNMG
jgi:GNAT superfamily N-acetyltransferase